MLTGAANSCELGHSGTMDNGINDINATSKGTMASAANTLSFENSSFNGLGTASVTPEDSMESACIDSAIDDWLEWTFGLDTFVFTGSTVSCADNSDFSQIAEKVADNSDFEEAPECELEDRECSSFGLHSCVNISLEDATDDVCRASDTISRGKGDSDPVDGSSIPNSPAGVSIGLQIAVLGNGDMGALGFKNVDDTR